MQFLVLALISTAAALQFKSNTVIDFPAWTCTDTKHVQPGEQPTKTTIQTKDLLKAVGNAVLIGNNIWKGNLVEFDVTFTYNADSNPPYAHITNVEWNSVSSLS